MERIGIYGGTFNPPHAGHIQAAKQAVTALNLDKLVIVPTSIAPHKEIPEHSPTPRQRLEMLRIAAGNARAERVNVPFVCQDMRRLALHRPADAVLAVCDGVNYLTLKGAESFFANAYAALREGGMLLFDISSRYKLSTILGNNTFAEDESAAAYIWKNAYDEQTKQIQMELTLFEKQADGRYVRFNESQIQRAHSQREMEGALKRAGFERIEAFDAFTFDAPNEKSERIQFRAIKPND